MPNVLYEQNGAIAKITLNRPEKMNAYNYPLHSELLSAIARGDKDKTVRAIVVTGAGKAFCAGADLDLGFAAGDFVNETNIIDGVQRDIGGILNIGTFEADTPIIAAVNGHAIGIGAASFFLPRVVGLSKAQEWILKGDIILADEALQAGLVSEVVEPDQVLSRAMEIAEDIAVNVSPESAARNKQLIRASAYGDTRYGSPSMSAHMMESKFLVDAFKSEDCIEGVQSFMEKRAPKFKDRS